MSNINHKHKVIATGVLTLMVLALSSLFFVSDKSHLLTNIMGVPQHAPFDGTTYPIQKVPNWVKVTVDNDEMHFNDLSTNELINTPYYNPSQLETSTSTLTWGNPQHDEIRNAKITYSVPYMGNYLLDGKEFGGSHLAVDIKIPKGTPVFSMANGVVTKAIEQSSGFGNHIVVKHNNFPTLNDPNAKKTLYSSYNHLDSLFVSEGDIVTKGQKIALSGDSGTSTTAHLHFQIDNDDAPWHPFWPFTFQEATDAGYDFFSAINNGLGRDKALATTVNPMKYVQKYLDSSFSPTTPEAEPITTVPTVTTQPKTTPDPIDTSNMNFGNNAASSYVNSNENSEVIEEVILDPPKLQFEFELLSNYKVGGDSSFNIAVKDQFGNFYTEGFADEIIIESVSGNVTPNSVILRYLNFEDGRYRNSFKRMVEGRDRLKIKYNNEEFYSDWFEIRGTGEKDVFSDIAPSHEYYDSIVYLSEKGIISGYPDNSFKPAQNVTRVEAIKFILEGIKANVSPGSLPFTDVSSSEWYSPYLYTAFKNEVVDGYPDGSFKPENKVNRAEFYKILFNGMNVEIDPVVKKNPFPDVPATSWYASYFSYAKEIGLIDSSVNRIEPSGDMTRGEVADVMYRLMQYNS